MSSLQKKMTKNEAGGGDESMNAQIKRVSNELINDGEKVIQSFVRIYSSWSQEAQIAHKGSVSAARMSGQGTDVFQKTMDTQCFTVWWNQDVQKAKACEHAH